MHDKTGKHIKRYNNGITGNKMSRSVAALTSVVIETFKKSLETKTETSGEGLETKVKTSSKDLETKPKTSAKVSRSRPITERVREQQW